jgi:hypothetical protein
MEPGLRRFWLEFDLPPSLPPAGHEPAVGASEPSPWALLETGVGVTGEDLEECFAIVRNRIFGRALMPAVLKVVEDIDVSTLDKERVLPNIEPPIWRGIWFPPGFGDSPMT